MLPEVLEWMAHWSDMDLLAEISLPKAITWSKGQTGGGGSLGAPLWRGRPTSMEAYLYGEVGQGMQGRGSKMKSQW